VKEKISRIFNKYFGFLNPKTGEVFWAIKSFSKTEKNILGIFVIIFIFSSIVLGWKINQSFLVEIPIQGGSVSEGIIGAPRFINPLLALSEADRDLTTLVYSGLLRATPDGDLENDLAESFTISDDGLSYNFILKDNIYFHDGQKVTVDDIIFTVHKIQDSILKSPKRASWEGVDIEKINEKEIQFTLKRAYSPFLENTTLGILPKHIWENISSEQFGFSQFNIEPIGSGPYKVTSIKRDSSGIPLYYDLKPFKKFSLGESLIANLRINFYSNEDSLWEAYDQGKIGSINTVSPEKAAILEKSGLQLKRWPLPRVFGAFFNQNQATIFTDRLLRKALREAVDKNMIVNEVLHGYATVIDGPIPPGGLGYPETEIKSQDIEETNHLDTAKEILENNGWKFNEEEQVLEKKTRKQTDQLRFSIATSNATELKAAAELIKKDWEALGAQVELKIFDTGDLNQNVIRPRKYDVLFFGEIIGRDSDPFAFWHSSQRNDPGLNISLYTNITADKLLEDGRTLADKEIRKDKYRLFQKEVAKDIPAVFVYSPDFIYLIQDNLKGVDIRHITIPSERFLNIHKWYIETDKVWKVFIK